VDAERKRQLKAWGKAETTRQSEALHAALRDANPAQPGDDQWAGNYRRGVAREHWLRKETFPVLHADHLNEMFVVLPWGSNTWSPYVGGYVLCAGCGSALPSTIPRRLFYWASCECRNVRYRCFLGWRRCRVKDPSKLSPVKLVGKG
jgi:hypothetical protein